MQRFNVLVTGAGGFIGQHLVKHLLTQGAKVRALFGPNDDLQDKTDQLQQLYLWRQADMEDADNWDELLIDIETIVHLAGPPFAAQSFNQPLSYTHTHVLGTVNLLNQARQHNINRLIYVSSAEVYGLPLTNPVTELHPVAPRSPYAAAKLAAEYFIQSYARSFSMKAIIFRPFSIYGPGMHTQSLLGTILEQSINRDVINIFNADSVRDFCYINDFVELLTQALGEPSSDTFEAPIYNVGSGRGYSVKEIVSTLATILHRKLEIHQLVEQDRPIQANIAVLISDISKTKQTYSWQPYYSLEMGLRTAWTYFSQQAVSN